MHPQGFPAQGIIMDLNMSCMSITIDDLLRCSFGLSKLEVRVLMRLMDAPSWSAIPPIARSMGRDRSLIQKGLSSLLSKGIIEREQRNKPSGGYEYLYRAKDKRMIRRAILDRGRAFSLMVQEKVRRW